MYVVEKSVRKEIRLEIKFDPQLGSHLITDLQMFIFLSMICEKG